MCVYTHTYMYTFYHLYMYISYIIYYKLTSVINKLNLILDLGPIPRYCINIYEYRDTQDIARG